MNGLYGLWVLIASAGGGFIQATTGFGYGIIAMAFFPLLMNVVDASSVSIMSNTLAVFFMAWRYRKGIHWKDILLPSFMYIVVCTVCVRASMGMALSGLSALLGVLMLMLAIWLYFFSNRVKICANLPAGIICSALSGAMGGLFGIGGPPMTLYYLAYAGEDKLVYMGTLQAFFCMTTVVNTITRGMSGLIHASILPYILPATAGMIIGTALGGKINERIDFARLRKVVFLFLGISGVITFLTNVIVA